VGVESSTGERLLVLFSAKNSTVPFPGPYRAIFFIPPYFLSSASSARTSSEWWAGSTLVHSLTIFPWGVDEESVAVGNRPCSKVAQRAVRIHDFVFRVGEQAEGEPFFGAELLVAVRGVDAHAHNDGMIGIEFGLIALEVMGFEGAA
jgi:hypothetical protein